MTVRHYQDKLHVQRRKKFLKKLAIIAAGLFLLCIGVIYGLFFANAFDVQLINIDVPDGISKDDIQNIANAWLDTKQFFIKRRYNDVVFAPQDLVPVLAQAFPSLDDIKVEKTKQHEITISAMVRKPSGIWCSTKSSQCYFYDNKEVIYAPTDLSTKINFVPIDDERNLVIIPGNHLDNDFIQPIQSAIKLLEIAKVDIDRVTIPGTSPDEFDVMVKDGYKILMSKSFSVDQQVKDLSLLLRQKITPEEQKTLQYIDLRIQGRAYYE